MNLFLLERKMLLLCSLKKDWIEPFQAGFVAFGGVDGN